MSRHFDWRHIRSVFFDVDGTLYCQKRLRRYMSIQLFFYYIKRFNKINDIYILYKFRKYRELIAKNNIPNFQKKQYETVAVQCHTSIEHVMKLVDFWIMKKPLSYIFNCRFPYILEFINALHSYNIKTIAFSDYPAKEKISALELPIQILPEEIVCLKPNPYGLQKIIWDMNLISNRCVLIGDRYDRDGECAKAVGMPYLLKNNKDDSSGFRSYKELKNELEKCFHD